MTPKQEDLCRRWTAALRGGCYKQGIGALATTDGAHCALGVLARVAGLPHRPCPQAGKLVEFYGGAHTMPPRLFRDLTGLPDRVKVRATTLNDYGATFDEIADVVELAMVEAAEKEVEHA